MSRALPALALAGLAALGGCTGTCEELCGKLDRCGLDPQVEAAECEAACGRELSDVQDDSDTQARKDFDAVRRCLHDSTCEEIAAGTCYEDDQFPF